MTDHRTSVGASAATAVGLTPFRASAAAAVGLVPGGVMTDDRTPAATAVGLVPGGVMTISVGLTLGAS
ncbi:hypothetical protein [Dactylosporangium sp. CS-033363]|uniref:hypothetical protein n=1 Tax=Dactylosporangium sp. CS-033363 TaxID=3239935 RepID=UPI003D8B67D6